MRTHPFFLTVLACLVFTIPGAAYGQEGAALPFAGTAAVKLGGSWFGMFSELGAAANVELEGGVLLLENRLDVSLSIGWARPPASSSGADPRFESGDYAWDLTQDFLVFGLMGRYRFLSPASAYNVYAGAGPRLLLLQTKVNGESGAQGYGENTQTETRVGGVLVGGGEYRLGPGQLVVEASFGIGSIDGLITGQALGAGLGLQVGYRYVF